MSGNIDPISQEQPYRVLRTAFSVLTDQEIENFRHHLKAETPVLCGVDFGLWTDGAGAG